MQQGAPCRGRRQRESPSSRDTTPGRQSQAPRRKGEATPETPRPFLALSRISANAPCRDRGPVRTGTRRPGRQARLSPTAAAPRPLSPPAAPSFRIPDFRAPRDPQAPVAVLGTRDINGAAPAEVGAAQTLPTAPRRPRIPPRDGGPQPAAAAPRPHPGSRRRPWTRGAPGLTVRGGARDGVRAHGFLQSWAPLGRRE